MRNQRVYVIRDAVTLADLADVVDGETAMIAADPFGLRLIVSWPTDLSAEDINSAHLDLLDRARLRGIVIEEEPARRRIGGSSHKEKR